MNSAAMDLLRTPPEAGPALQLALKEFGGKVSHLGFVHAHSVKLKELLVVVIQNQQRKAKMCYFESQRQHHFLRDCVQDKMAMCR